MGILSTIWQHPNHQLNQYIKISPSVTLVHTRGSTAPRASCCGAGQCRPSVSAASRSAMLCAIETKGVAVCSFIFIFNLQNVFSLKV